MRRSAVFQFRSGRSFFHRLDPMTKLAWLVGISLLAFGAYIAWVQIVITAVVLFTALALARLSPLEIWRGTWLFVLACTSFLVIQTFTLPGTHVAFRIAGHPIYAESFDYALASALRIYTIILSSLVFVRTTDPRELAIALVTQMKMPYRIAYAFFIALRIIPTIEDEIKTIRAAQSVRGVARSGRGRGPHPRDEALCHAAPGGQPAESLDDGHVDGVARLRGLPATDLRGSTPDDLGRRHGLRDHADGRDGLVPGAGARLRPHHVRAGAGLRPRHPGPARGGNLHGGPWAASNTAPKSSRPASLP